MERKHTTIRLDDYVLIQLKQYCLDNNISIQRLVEDYILHLLYK
ncbi:hypothetical protein [Cellulosilyticum lentocellum]|nr:hypothetical protein [Cellulosilyticum lentocellum]